MTSDSFMSRNMKMQVCIYQYFHVMKYENFDFDILSYNLLLMLKKWICIN